MSESDDKWSYIKDVVRELDGINPIAKLRLSKAEHGALVSKCNDSIHFINQLSKDEYFGTASLARTKDVHYAKLASFIDHKDLYEGLSKFTTFKYTYIMKVGCKKLKDNPLFECF
jgi:hypothetical protein